MQYPNFYENLKEARDRLLRTVVLYDGTPYYIIAITDHKGDGIFRVWLDPIDIPDKSQPIRYITQNYKPDHPALGQLMDKELERLPECGILRKHMNSPKFNRFRPFPLGMCNVGTQTYYIERQPIRPKMEQGLTKAGLFETLITAGSRLDNPKRSLEVVDMFSGSFRDCILGDHHDAYTVLANLLNPRIANDAHAFHREFALVRGPVGMIFLAYRSDIIGVLPHNTFGVLKLGDEFGYCREVVEELNLFNLVM